MERPGKQQQDPRIASAMDHVLAAENSLQADLEAIRRQIQALEEKLDTRLNVSEDSHYMGALGAALFGLGWGAWV